MRLSIKTCTLDMPFAAMLDFCVAQGVQAVEIGTGNWSGAPHIDLDELLGSETAPQRWRTPVPGTGCWILWGKTASRSPP